MKKMQCVYCGKIIYFDYSYGQGLDEYYEDEQRRKKVSRYERCPSNRTKSGQLGGHSLTGLY